MKTILMLSLLMVGCGNQTTEHLNNNYKFCTKYSISTFDLGGISAHDLGNGILVNLDEIQLRPEPFVDIVNETIFYEGCELVVDGLFEYMNKYDMKKVCKYQIQKGNIIIKSGCEND